RVAAQDLDGSIGEHVEASRSISLQQQNGSRGEVLPLGAGTTLEYRCHRQRFLLCCHMRGLHLDHLAPAYLISRFCTGFSLAQVSLVDRGEKRGVSPVHESPHFPRKTADSVPVCPRL